MCVVALACRRLRRAWRRSAVAGRARPHGRITRHLTPRTSSRRFTLSVDQRAAPGHSIANSRGALREPGATKSSRNDARAARRLRQGGGWPCLELQARWLHGPLLPASPARRTRTGETRALAPLVPLVPLATPTHNPATCSAVLFDAGSPPPAHPPRLPLPPPAARAPPAAAAAAARASCRAPQRRRSARRSYPTCCARWRRTRSCRPT